MGRTNTTLTGKLLTHALAAALVAFVFGLCLGHTLIKHFDRLYFSGMSLSGILLVLVLFATHRAVRLATANHSTSNAFLTSCVVLSMISAAFGGGVSGLVWYSSDFIRTFGVVFWAGITGVATFCVRRDAKRVTDAVASPIALEEPAANRRRRVRLAITLALAICAGGLAAVATSRLLQGLPPEISASEFRSEVEQRHVDRVVIRDRELISGTSSTRGAFRVRTPVDDVMVNQLRSQGVLVEFETSSDLTP